MKKRMSSFAWGWKGRGFTEKTENGQEKRVLSTQGTKRMCKQRHKEVCSFFHVQVVGINRHHIFVT